MYSRHNPGRSVINVFGKVPKSKAIIPDCVINSGDAWAAVRVAELSAQGHQVRVVSKRNEAACVCYNLREAQKSEKKH